MNYKNWSPIYGDYESTEENYSKKHDFITKKEKFKSRLFFIITSLTIGIIYLIFLSLISKI